MHDMLNNHPPSDSITGLSMQVEADHRISNSLSIIASFMRLQARGLSKRENLSGKEAADLIEESAARTDTLAKLHRILSEQQGAACDCAAYLKSVGEAAAGLFSHAGSTQLRFDLTPGLYLDAARLAALGMLLNEAVINAHKYAHPSGVDGIVRVSCGPCEGGWALVVEDDGVGLPERFDPDTGGGLGFKVMRAMADKLEGRLRHVSDPLGHRVELILTP